MRSTTRIISRQPFFYTVRYSFPPFCTFPGNRKTRRTEVLRVSYVWTQRTLRYSIFRYIRSTRLRFRCASSQSGRSPYKSFVKYPSASKLPSDIFPVLALLIAYRILLDDCSNTSWSYSTSTFTISDRCIAVCKWWFFVWFVGENPDFPLCPCGFWGFCYHGVIIEFLVFLAYFFSHS